MSYIKTGCPTREELTETIFETYISITRSIQKLENIYRRESNSRRKKYREKQ